MLYFFFLIYFVFDTNYLSQVSYEEFKLQFAQMYEHYERHRTDNITDPALRRAHPISTISGWERERDETNVAPTNQSNAVNGNGIEADVDASTQQPMKISKSEQTDCSDIVDLESVKCVCTGDVEHEPATRSDVGESVSTEPKISSISSISQVYNQQMCNGNGNGHGNETTSSEVSCESSPVKQAADDADALRKTLGIDNFEANEESKEIVEEIVEEILQKSEHALEQCKRAFDEDTENAQSSVIKDEEIEHAVSEVVKGVRQIEKKSKQEAEIKVETTSELSTEEATGESERRSDHEKTDLELSSAIVASKNKQNKSVAAVEVATIDESTTVNEAETETETETETDVADVEQIAMEIVNDVIENCVNHTITNDTTETEKCDNNKTLDAIEREADNINNNNTNDQNESRTDIETELRTNDDNDNAIDAMAEETTVTTTKEPTQTEKTTEVAQAETNETAAIKECNREEMNEQIASCIVNEIIDNCVASDNNNNNNNNESNDSNESNVEISKENQPDDDKTTLESNESSGNAQVADSDEHENLTSDQSIRLKNATAINTGTQVESNHFGKFSIRFC